VTNPFPSRRAISTIYLVRHGQSHANVDQVFGLDSPLTGKGQAEAISLADMLEPIHFDAVFASELLRAKETAQIIATRRKLAVETKALLREKSWGSLEGKLKDDVRRDLDRLFKLTQTMPDQERATFKVTPDMESEAEMMSRYITVLREIALAYTGQTVLVVSHQTIMRTFLVHLGYVKYANLPEGSITNAGYIKLLSDGVDFYVEKTHGVNPMKESA
jgi:broad specificity phosphatase PhoE